MKYDIICLGEALIDNITINNITQKNPGGAPFNVAAVTSYNNINTSFIGKIGNDYEGIIIQKTANDFHINTDNLLIDNLHPTTQAFVSLDPNGNRSFTFNRDKSADIYLNKNDINQELFKNTKIFHFGSLSLVNETYDEATVFSIHLAKANNAIISYDPNYRKPLWESEKQAIETMCRYLHLVDILKISIDELYLITNTNDLTKAIENIKQYNIKIILITCDKDGAYIYHNNILNKVDTITIIPVDTTAAGDIFMGTFLSLLIKNNKSIIDITTNEVINYTQVACEKASLSTTQVGGITSLQFLSKI